MKKKNTSPLMYLALLGLLGLLGLFTDNQGFYGFFGFFGFFGYARHKNDERMKANLGKAGFYGFVVSVVGLCLTMVFGAFHESLEVALIGVATVFVLSVLTFTFTLAFLER